MHLTFKPAALGDLMNERIHALSIKASVPDEDQTRPA